LLTYNSPPAERFSRSMDLGVKYHFSENKPCLGFIGAGNYASRILIPAFQKAGGQLHTLVTANGINSVIHGKKAGFIHGSTDAAAMLNNPVINTVVIATQHNSHAKYVTDSLNANKHVWVEKPLAIDSDSLTLIKTAYKNAHERVEPSRSGPHLMVGFNRRFAPHIKKMHNLLSTVDAAKSIIITVNAGFISKEHWTQDPSIGGGRIIGEGCHFIDLMRFLVGERIVSVSGRAMTLNGRGPVMADRSAITLGFEDGSFGTIFYLANGPSDFPKERIEVFTDGKVLQLDNYRKLKGFGWKDFKKMNLFSQDKGQKACAEAFMAAIETGIPCIPVNEIFEVARVTIEANQILLEN